MNSSLHSLPIFKGHSLIDLLVEIIINNRVLKPLHLDPGQFYSFYSLHFSPLLSIFVKNKLIKIMEESNRLRSPRILSPGCHFLSPFFVCLEIITYLKTS